MVIPLGQERGEAYPHFFIKNTPKNAKIGSTSLLISQKGCASFSYFCEKWGLNFFSSKVGVLPSYFRDSSTATARSTVIPTMVTSLPAAGGGGKGKRSVCSGRRGTKPLRRQGHSPGTANGNDPQPAKAGCHHKPHGRIKSDLCVLQRSRCLLLRLLGSFLNSNSHGNGHTHHGVVTCPAQGRKMGFVQARRP
jgi:hypothetical protein